MLLNITGQKIMSKYVNFIFIRIILDQKKSKICFSCTFSENVVGGRLFILHFLNKMLLK